MKYLLIILSLITILTTSCSTECEKIMKGHVVNNVTGEDMPWFDVTIEGIKPGNWGAIYLDYNALTDEMGDFEISTNDPISSWDKVEILNEDYVIRSVEFARDRREECGENHVEIAVHELAEVEVEIHEDVDVWATSLKVYTEFNTHETREEFRANESLIIPVLEEVPNDLYILYFNSFQGTVERDTISVTVPSGETLKLNVGI